MVLSFAPYTYLMQEVIDLFFDALELCGGRFAVNHKRQAADLLDRKLSSTNPLIDRIAGALVLSGIRGDPEKHSYFK